MRHGSLAGWSFLGVVLAAPLTGAAEAAVQEGSPGGTNRLQALQAMRLEDLVVTTASKKEESVFRSAAAVTVISEDEIRRSGVRSIPEALRLAPGMQVAHLNANQWAISSRGFSDRFANKLLVLMDGRAVYTPAFGGVYWETPDYVLEDLERIEVVRGPGGTLWGANAVNGVVNVLSKDARDTQGTLVQGGGGTFEQGFGAVRHGFQIGEETYARVYGKFDNRGTFEPLPPETSAHDDWRMLRTGARTDWHGPDDHLTLQGDFYYGELGQRSYQPAYTPPFTRVTEFDVGSRGGNALGRWTRDLETAGELQVQTYYDRSEQQGEYFVYVLDTFDITAQHRLPLPARNELVYGLGYRVATDATDPTKPNAVFVPPDRGQQLFSVFAQDEWEAVPEHLRLIAGAKLEHHDFIGWQLQPSIRLAWTPDERNTVWSAVSRAVRSPSRTERDIILNLGQQGTAPNGLPIFPRGFGSDAFGEEVLTAYELGWRARVLSWAAFDLTGFYFDYDDLGSAQVGTPFFEAGGGVPRLIVPLSAINGAAAESAGFEAAFDFEVDPALRFRAGYSLLHIDVDNPTFAGGGKDPEQQFFLRGSLDLPGNLKFDAWARYVDGIPGIEVPAYFEVDLRLAWQARPWLEVAVVGQNLCDAQHQEFLSSGNTVTQTTEVPRSVYGQLTFRF